MDMEESELREDVLRTLWRIGGSACPLDLANEISRPMRGTDLIPVLDDMVARGVLRKGAVARFSRAPHEAFASMYHLGR